MMERSTKTKYENKILFLLYSPMCYPQRLWNKEDKEDTLRRNTPPPSLVPQRPTQLSPPSQPQTYQPHRRRRRPQHRTLNFSRSQCFTGPATHADASASRKREGGRAVGPSRQSCVPKPAVNTAKASPSLTAPGCRGDALRDGAWRDTIVNRHIE